LAVTTRADHVAEQRILTVDVGAIGYRDLTASAIARNLGIIACIDRAARRLTVAIDLRICPSGDVAGRALAISVAVVRADDVTGVVVVT
jgi:hypothetical protein